MKFSIVIPVYNRSNEVDELLASLINQQFQDFEVIVVDDGSRQPCDNIIHKYESVFPLSYFMKENSGPGPTRNFAAEKAHGDYLLILDSDCLLPEHYLENINKELEREVCDAFGGPDKAHSDFTTMQRAISYSMTSFFTTGGIRGGKKKLAKFYPRSFNMGIKRDVFWALGGFSAMRFGEDIDLSIRLFQNGYSCRLFPKAWVWHKRRTDLQKFFKQVHNSGIARINLWKRHPGTLKLIHWLPAIFTIGEFVLLVSSFVCIWALFPLFLFALLIFVDAFIGEHSLIVALKAVLSSFVQLTGYGSGFLRAFWQRHLLGKGEFSAFVKNFYK